jgi:type I restriction enzyme S subunit
MRIHSVNSLPADWQIASFGHCADITMGQSPKGNTYNTSGDGLPLLNGPAEFGHRFPVPVQWTTAPTRLAEKGDILFCVRGNTTGRMNLSDSRYCIGRGLAAIRGKDGETETQFVSFLLECIKPQIYSVAIGGGSTFPNISLSGLSGFQVPRPPLAEQRKIAAVLGLVQRAVDQQEQLQALSAELKKTLLHHLLIHGLQHKAQKQTEIGPIPQSWDVVSIGDLTTTVYRYPTYYGITYVDTGVPEIRGELLLENGAIEDDRSKYRFITEETATKFPKVRLEAGDIVMSVRGTMGKIGLITDQLSGSVITANLIRLAPNRARIFPQFFRWALLTPRFVQSLNAASPQTTIKTITAPNLKELKLPLPSLQEQKEIADSILSADRKEQLHHRKHAALSALFRTLLHELMTARIRVHNLHLPELETAAVA